MLYDNALLVELMTEVHKTTESPLYEVRIRETLSWVLRDMMNGEGNEQAFASAYDADSEGEEGKFYVWSETEIDQLLGPASEMFKSVYDVTPYGNWEGNTILNRSNDLNLLSSSDETILLNARGNLLSVRDKRIWPERDHKILTDWNGLMISALVQASLRFKEPVWMDAAKTAFDFICSHLTQNSRLLHSWCQGAAAHPATLDDYANMSRAALALFQARGDQVYLDKAIDWVSVLDRHYWDTDKGGYFLSSDDTADVIIRSKTCQDNAVPPGNGTMLEVLAKLYLLTGDAAYQDRADHLINAMTPTDPNASFYSLTLLSGFDFMTKAIQVVIVPSDDPEKLMAMRTAVLHSTASNIVLMTVNDATSLPNHHPAHGKTIKDNVPTAYVCIGTTCGLPLTSPDSLSQALKDIG